MSSTPPPPGPGQPGQPQNPYQTGSQPPFGQNPYAPGPGQNPYAPGPGQNPYGQAPFGQAPAPQGGKGLAVAALVLAFLPLCLTQVAAFIMGIVVLTSRRAGRGLAIAAIVVSLVMVGVLLVLGLAGIGSLVGAAVADLKRGECIDADGLTDDKSDSVSVIQVVSCDEPHDGEVLAAGELSAEAAQFYGDPTRGDFCEPYVTLSVLESLPANMTMTSLTESPDPARGDAFVCIAHRSDGSQLTKPLR
ncbi:DUF4190 domain-containing protein [Nocardioides nanhaiensis]|uniref:DUF4190 domain-containing protein n=1 Tax=Nocardioides nanhaiensis TaxID=1476871 RepID=A0ABP8W3U7_9ACTN